MKTEIVIKYQCAGCGETINSWHENSLLCKRCHEINLICACQHTLKQHSARTGHCLARQCLCRHFRKGDLRPEKSLKVFMQIGDYRVL